MAGGWIRVHRKTANHSWLGYNNPNRKEPLSEFEAWIDILFEVNHTEGRVMIGRKALICERGESLNSVTTCLPFVWPFKSISFGGTLPFRVLW